MAEHESDMAALLLAHRHRLVGFLIKEASGLRRFEDAEDLAQGVHLHALKVAKHFEYRTEKEFISWLFTVARRYIATRNAYWKALKRDAGPMLRVTFGAGSTPGGAVPAPPARATGPQTFAQRREHLSVAAKAIAALPERDRQIAELVSSGSDIAGIAEALGITYEAAQRARLRTLERFGKLFTIASATR